MVKSKLNKQFLLILDEDLLRRLDAFADKMTFNRNQAVRYILKNYLDDKV